MIEFHIPGEPVAFARSGGHGTQLRTVRVHGQKASDAEIWNTYCELRNVWKVGERLGMCGQTVQERLKKLDYTPNDNPITEVDRARIRNYYAETPAETFDLSDLANEMGRTRHLICRYAGEMGLTSYKRARAAAHEVKLKAAGEGRWTRNPHPRGMAGKPQTEKAKTAVRQASLKKWATDKAFGIGHMSEEARQRRSDQSAERMALRPAETNYSRCKHGRRADLGDTFFRSSWEANYARYLNLLLKMGAIRSWEYEPTTFWFEEIRRGVRSYKPDFAVVYQGETRLTYIEVKGWMDDKSKTKLKRMKKYHPTVKIELVGAKQYRALQDKWKGAIPTWE